MSVVPSSEGLDLLAFSPHPDDAEMCCGGTLIAMADRGYRVGIVDLTAGELSSNGTVELRRKEAAAAGRMIGLCHRENLGLPDGWLAPWSGETAVEGDHRTRSQVAAVVEAIRRLRPEIAMLPWREDRHPDHRAAHQLVSRALFFANVARFETVPDHPRHRPRRVLCYQMRQRFKPSLIVDISTVAERKLEAIRCYESQFFADPGGVPTLLNGPQGLAWIDVRDRYYGAMAGVERGEPLICADALAVSDPIALFRDSPAGPVALYEDGPEAF